MMKERRQVWIGWAMLMALTASVSAEQSPERVDLQPGRQVKAAGVIVERSADAFTLRDHNGSEMAVALTSETRIREKKTNPLRGARQYSENDLVLGLHVRVKGVGDLSGRLIANEIRFTGMDLKVAKTIASRVEPVEQRLGDAEGRLEESEKRASFLTGEVEELEAAFTTARNEALQAQSEARSAQKTADQALDGVGRTNQRISALDEFETLQTSDILFAFNRADLSAAARSQLDQLVEQAKEHPGFLIEVRGFASADGDDQHNLRLSRLRAESVVRYLVEDLGIPIRRITNPHGYGEASPAADNATLDGRKKNRRVEVRLLVNRGLRGFDPSQ